MAHNLNDLRMLRDQWDGYDGVPPSEAALRTAQFLNYTPMSGGGIMIELHAGGMNIEIEINADGRVCDVAVTLDR